MMMWKGLNECRKSYYPAKSSFFLIARKLNSAFIIPIFFLPGSTVVRLEFFLIHKYSWGISIKIIRLFHVTFWRYRSINELPGRTYKHLYYKSAANKNWFCILCTQQFHTYVCHNADLNIV